MLEILIYTVILIILMMVVVNVIISMERTYRALSSQTALQSSALTALERMTREIRDSSSVDMGVSVLGSSPGVLQLNTTDDAGAAMTIQFFVSNQTVRIKENGVDSGPLTASTVRVTNLMFRKITTAQSQAVKIDLTLESGTSTSYRQQKFYSTVVLRGSYPAQ